MGKINKRDTENRNISFILFIFRLFSSIFDLSLSFGKKFLGEKVFFSVTLKMWGFFIYIFFF